MVARRTHKVNRAKQAHPASVALPLANDDHPRSGRDIPLLRGDALDVTAR